MKLDLARKPTPVEKHVFEGKEIWIKRDDMTDFIASGNKIRKLEYLLGDALEKKVDVVITCGALQSNHARATNYLSKRLGMKVILYLKEWYPGKESGNFLLNKLMGAEINIITPEEYENVDEIMEEKARELEKGGKRAYVIPEGGSNHIGSKGYEDAVFEMSRQLNLEDFDAIYVATSSAGTYAGILSGVKKLRLKIEVRGVVVHKKPTEIVREKIERILSQLGLEDHSGINLIRGFEGKDYAYPSEEDLKVIKYVASESGVFLDPVYTAKAFRGMLETMGDQERVVFIHTGGTFGLFAQIEALEGII